MISYHFPFRNRIYIVFSTISNIFPIFSSHSFSIKRSPYFAVNSHPAEPSWPCRRRPSRAVPTGTLFWARPLGVKMLSQLDFWNQFGSFRKFPQMLSKQIFIEDWILLVVFHWVVAIINVHDQQWIIDYMMYYLYIFAVHLTHTHISGWSGPQRAWKLSWGHSPTRVSTCIQQRWMDRSSEFYGGSRWEHLTVGW